MGRLNIADDLTRLRGEIKVGHADRHAFVKGIAENEVKARAERQEFFKGIRQEVAAMRQGFRRQNKERAIEVMAQLRETREDMARAHQAWFGPSPAERRAMAAAERRAKHEAEQRIKEAAERDRMAALAMAKEEAIRHQDAQKTEEAKGTEPGPKGPAKKK
jgi:hypothetical protein